MNKPKPTYESDGMQEKNGFRFRAYIRNDGAKVMLTRAQVSRLRAEGRITKRPPVIGNESLLDLTPESVYEEARTDAGNMTEEMKRTELDMPEHLVELGEGNGLLTEIKSRLAKSVASSFYLGSSLSGVDVESAKYIDLIYAKYEIDKDVRFYRSLIPTATSSGEEFIRAVNGPQATSSDPRNNLPLEDIRHEDMVREMIDRATSSDASKPRRVLLSPRQNADKIDELRRSIDNIKIRAYELGEEELHDMALAALEQNNGTM
jgi:hypothetical protein